MYSVLLAVHVLFCILVILIILLHAGKGAGFSGLLGGGNSDALFNAPSGSMFMRKMTTGLAVGFFLTSLFLTILGATQRVSTVTRSFPGPYNPAAGSTIPPAGPQRSQAAPVAPAAAPAPAKK